MSSDLFDPGQVRKRDPRTQYAGQVLRPKHVNTLRGCYKKSDIPDAIKILETYGYRIYNYLPVKYPLSCELSFPVLYTFGSTSGAYSFRTVEFFQGLYQNVNPIEDLNLPGSTGGHFPYDIEISIFINSIEVIAPTYHTPTQNAADRSIWFSITLPNSPDGTLPSQTSDQPYTYVTTHDAAFGPWLSYDYFLLTPRGQQIVLTTMNGRIERSDDHPEVNRNSVVQNRLIDSPYLIQFNFTGDVGETLYSAFRHHTYPQGDANIQLLVINIAGEPAAPCDFAPGLIVLSGSFRVRLTFPFGMPIESLNPNDFPN